MVTRKEYEAYLKVRRFIDGHNEAEIISRLMGDNKYVPLIIESDGTNPIKYYSTSAAAKHYWATKQTLDYAHRNRCTRIVRRKGGVKEFNLELLGYRFTYPWISEPLVKINPFWTPIFSTIPL